MRLQRGDSLRSIGRGDVARQIETPRNRAPITIEQQIAAVDLEVELTADADQQRVWRAVAKTLRAAARAARDDAASTGRET